MFKKLSILYGVSLVAFCLYLSIVFGFASFLSIFSIFIVLVLVLIFLPQSFYDNVLFRTIAYLLSSILFLLFLISLTIIFWRGGGEWTVDLLLMICASISSSSVFIFYRAKQAGKPNKVVYIGLAVLIISSIVTTMIFSYQSRKERLKMEEWKICSEKCEAEFKTRLKLMECYEFCPH